jgi:hypothetical protein
MHHSVRIAVAGILVVIFLAPLATAVSDRTLAIGAIGLLIVAVFALVLNSVQSSEEQSGSTWDLIPRWQYEGRHVEMGGATRTEQERAIQEIQEEAEGQDTDRR